MSKLSLTERKIIGKLTENTGRHMLDSGDAYGRNWEQNQGRKFTDEPEAKVDFSYGIEVTVNLFHWLRKRVEYNWRLQGKFTRFANQPGYKYTPWLQIMEDFVKLHGTGEGWTVNTYNGEDALSQIIQYVEYTDKDTDTRHALIQIHGGCDARGGYTSPLACDLHEPGGLADNAKAEIWCPACYIHWWTDDTYNWYNDGVPDLDDEPKLFDVERDASVSSLPDLKDMERVAEPVERRGVLYVDSEGHARCPHCLKANLEASAYPV